MENERERESGNVKEIDPASGMRSSALPLRPMNSVLHPFHHVEIKKEEEDYLKAVPLKIQHA